MTKLHTNQILSICLQCINIIASLIDIIIISLLETSPISINYRCRTQQINNDDILYACIVAMTKNNLYLMAKLS